MDRTLIVWTTADELALDEQYGCGDARLTGRIISVIYILTLILILLCKTMG